MIRSRDKAVANLIARALLDAGANASKLSAAVNSFLSSYTTVQRYLMSSAQHRARAKQLRDWNPRSRAAELHDLAAHAIEGRSRGKKTGRVRVALALLSAIVSCGLSISDARAQQATAASCRAWEDRAQQAAHPSAAMIARHDQLMAKAAQFKAEAEANYNNVAQRQAAIENEVQAEGDAGAVYDWRSDLQNASSCWEGVALAQGIRRDQQQRLNQLAKQLSAEQPPAQFAPPHSVYVLGTQPPAAPPPSPIPNLGSAYEPAPPVLTWGQTPCAPALPPAMRELPVTSTDPKLPEGCK